MLILSESRLAGARWVITTYYCNEPDSWERNHVMKVIGLIADFIYVGISYYVDETVLEIR